MDHFLWDSSIGDCPSMFDAPDWDPDQVEEEVAFLEWIDTNQSDLLAECFDLAKLYYTWMHDQITTLRKDIWKFEDTVNHGPWNPFSAEDYKKLNTSKARLELLEGIINAHRIIEDIQSHREAIDRIIAGKSFKEILEPDEIDELTDINYDAQNEGAGAVQDNEEQLWEEIIKLIQDEEEGKAKEQEKIANAQKEQAELDQECENLRLSMLGRARQINTAKLLLEVNENIRNQDAFFESQKYTTLFNWDSALKQWDFGKLVLVIQFEKKEFSLVFGKHKIHSVPPDNLKDAMRMTHSHHMKDDSWEGLHRNIETPPVSIHLWWAQYIMLEDNLVLIGGNSRQYGSISKEIAKRCLEASGYRVHFLDNAAYQTLGDVRHRLHHLFHE